MATAPSFDGTQECMKVDPDLFFPEPPVKPKRAEVASYEDSMKTYNIQLKSFRQELASAKAICNGCQFITPCLEYALLNDVVGVWGGTTEQDRKELRRDMRMSSPRSITLVTAKWAKEKGPQ